MSTAIGVVRSLAGWLAVGLPISLGAATVELNANGISGDYDDEGTLVEASSDADAFAPSFAALLRLDFDARMAAIRDAETSRINVQHGGGMLVIRIYDTDDEVIWTGRWREGTNYVQHGNAILLRIQRPASETEQILLTFEPVAENRLLQLTVQRVQPTVFGPGVVKRNVYLFARSP